MEMVDEEPLIGMYKVFLNDCEDHFTHSTDSTI